MGDVVFEGKVEKFSLGRTVGITTRNWKSRTMTLTRSTLSYGDGGSSTPKLEVPISAISIVFRNPSTFEHAEAKGNAPYIMIRLFENGVFNLLVKCPNEVDKAKWITAFTETLERVKGAQMA